MSFGGCFVGRLVGTVVRSGAFLRRMSGTRRRYPMAMLSIRSPSIRSRVTMLALATVAAGTLTACVASSGPRAVRAENPSITYNYRTDQDLVQASQNAANYCAQYQSVQRTSRISNNPDGTNTVI